MFSKTRGIELAQEWREVLLGLIFSSLLQLQRVAHADSLNIIFDNVQFYHADAIKEPIELWKRKTKKSSQIVILEVQDAQTMTGKVARRLPPEAMRLRRAAGLSLITNSINENCGIEAEATAIHLLCRSLHAGSNRNQRRVTLFVVRSPCEAPTSTVSVEVFGIYGWVLKRALVFDSGPTAC